MKHRGSCHCGKVAYEVERCIGCIDLDSIPVKHFDGHSM